MKTIHFKGGLITRVPDEVVEVLQKKIVEGCDPYQCFTNDDGEVWLIINIDDIAYID